MGKTVIKVPWDGLGTFKKRPNRFLAVYDIEVDGKVLKDQQVHVHDPGRLKELCFPGNPGLVRRAPPGGNRKTQWDLLAARAGRRWVFIHSAYHRWISEWVLNEPSASPFGKIKKFKAEVSVGGHSRIDFFVTKRDGTEVALEVKGCSLAVDGVALFPDAPTERGTRHINTLMELKKKGMDAAVMILVFRPEARCFAPKEDTDPVFARTLYEAVSRGLKVYPIVLKYNKSTMKIEHVGKIPLKKCVPPDCF